MSTSDQYHTYIYDLPYCERKSLCRILDVNNKWQELGGMYMKFDVGTLQHVGQAIFRNQSPTDELLTLWGTKNHTVLELFILLSKMQHYQAMTVLKNEVDPKYHRLIYEGEENLSRILISHRDNKSLNNDKFVDVDAKNLNQGSKPANCNKNLLLNSRDGSLEIALKENGVGARRMSGDETNGTFGENSGISINYADLEAATGHWDPRNLLGKGGFGTVYKGIWKNTAVAVKRLEIHKEDGDMEKNWKTHREQSLRELKYLNSCRHDNILPLYGYSIGGLHDCLVYQLMPSGSLEDRLMCRDGSRPLRWSQRREIATGSARGLQFLHTVGDKPLIHGDIKSANILLDPFLVPKIGDFGLAREGPHQQYTHVKVSRVHGTRAYLPFEFLRAKRFSTKVDTYSFGIVLFEIATGLRAYDDARQHKYLKELVEATDEDIEDIRDQKAGSEEETIFRMLISLGKWCVANKPKDRPEMVLVLQHLDSMACTREVIPNAISERCTGGLRVPNNQLVVPEISIDVHETTENESEAGGLPLISELGIKSTPSLQSDDCP